MLFPIMSTCMIAELIANFFLRVERRRPGWMVAGAGFTGIPVVPGNFLTVWTKVGILH